MRRAAVPLRESYGRGTFHRQIRLISEPGAVRGELEDDFHHFRALLRHDGRRVLQVEGEGVRFPWTTCPDAIGAVDALATRALSSSLRQTVRGIDPRSQCTHLLDLASLAISHASSGRERRHYDIAIPDRIRGRTRASLHRDGKELLFWELDGYAIAAPERFENRSIVERGFPAWLESALGRDDAEAALVLRRTCIISLGRRYDFDRIQDASAFGAAIGGGCYTFSPQVVGRARPIR
jgi:hypothetical protein